MEVKSKSLVEELLNDPSILVGKRIKHKVQETDNNEPEWFDAKVLKIEKASKTPVRTKYEVAYDIDEEDTTFIFSLISELKSGKLVVLWL